MKQSSLLETLVGIVVVAVAVVFFNYAYGAAGRTIGGSTYDINAVFGRVDGLSVGAEVKIAGIKVGSVTTAALDDATYEARLTMAINDTVAIPDDSVAKVASEGLLGGAHISIEPGASDDMLVEGDQLVLTQGSVDLLGLAVQSFTEGGSAPEASADQLGDLPPIIEGDDE
ncbi:MAG: outer membrane lipid asymmetry maintenance protein MlaD [Pseudomonadota bacterium]